MTDNAVTDDDLRVVYAWLNDGYGEDTPIKRVLRAYLPTPPRPLADELRDICKEYSGDVEADLEPLADRVDEMEGKLRDTYKALVFHIENSAKCMAERDEARADVELLTQERLDRNPETKNRVDEALDNLDQAESVTINTATGKPASFSISGELLSPDSYGEDTDGQYVVFDQNRMMKIVKRVEALEEMVK